MSESLLREYLRQLLEAHRTPEVTVSWQGGEPTLMGLQFFRRSMDIVTELAGTQRTVEHTMQTNATLIDDEWARFLAEHDVLVGVSVDGPKDLHDVYRVEPARRPRC